MLQTTLMSDVSFICRRHGGQHYGQLPVPGTYLHCKSCVMAGTRPAGGMGVSDLHSSLSQEVLPRAALLAASLQPPRGLLGRRAALRSARSQAELDAARPPGSGGGSQAGLHPGSLPAEPEPGSNSSEEGAVKAAAVTAGVAAGAGHAL